MVRTRINKKLTEYRSVSFLRFPLEKFSDATDFHLQVVSGVFFYGLLDVSHKFHNVRSSAAFGIHEEVRVLL